MVDNDYSNQVAVIIPAHNEEHVIAETVRACKIIPGVDLVVVVDDGSTDDTQHVARNAGAVVVRHSVNRGKHSALETGVKVAQMRDPELGRGRMVLFMDADVGESAVETITLINEVREGADLAVALSPDEATSGGRGVVTRLASRILAKKTGWKSRQPLSGQRCFSPEAAACILPVSYGWGVDLGTTFTILKKGMKVVEVPCNIRHANGAFPGWGHRFSQYKDVGWALWRQGYRGL
ncbi:glycosyltransferase family 2 protein [Actinomycetaceae bacterium TAE3-ERU4]|nr:glycosyltransferase family 2 protein [Actinomycetaceae bacterium TAE3-ERU4]